MSEHTWPTDQVLMLRDMLVATQGHVCRIEADNRRLRAALEEIADMATDSHNVRYAFGEAREIASRALEVK